MIGGGNAIDKCFGKGFDDDKKKFHKGGACSRIVNGNCLAYLFPELKWREGLLSGCPLATHYNESVVADQGKKRVGQQKQKKRG